MTKNKTSKKRSGQTKGKNKEGRVATYIFLNLSGIVESLSLHQKHGNLLLDVHAQVFVEFQNFLEEGLAILGIHYSGFIAF